MNMCLITKKRQDWNLGHYRLAHQRSETQEVCPEILSSPNLLTFSSAPAEHWPSHPPSKKKRSIALPYSWPVDLIRLAVWKAKLEHEDLPELPVLPAVHQQVGAGVEHEQQVGELGYKVTPGGNQIRNKDKKTWDLLSSFLWIIINCNIQGTTWLKHKIEA